MIQNITIQNVRGIANQPFPLDIFPNKPSLLVAPNGFGKSSLFTAFQHLSSKKLDLPEEHYHQGNITNAPSLSITHRKLDNTIETLVADTADNAISRVFDIFVINSQLIAKARKHKIGSTVTASSSMEITPVILTDSIPKRSNFTYLVSSHRSAFGKNGKIFDSIEAILANKKLITKVFHTIDFRRFGLSFASKRFIQATQEINAYQGSTQEVFAWAEVNQSARLEEIPELKALSDALGNSTYTFTSNFQRLLCAWQIVAIYLKDSSEFANVVKSYDFELEKEFFTDIISSFNPTWKKIRPVEKDGKLILEFPRAYHVSNGERDVLCFIALLLRARQKLKKQYCILLIDEVFDYLDDANLIAVQYHTSILIDTLKKEGKYFYPLILTHLNPYYFRNFIFSKQKVYYLDHRIGVVNPHFEKMLFAREDVTIKANLARHHLHFAPTAVNIRPQFAALHLKQTWGDSAIFHTFIAGELTKYLNDQPDFDPFAICCAVRVKVEENIFKKITDPAHRQQFIDTHGTNEKLEFAESITIPVPEIYYLLGIIYNEGLHIKPGIDYASPISSKLANNTIRNMIRRIFN